MSGGFNAQDMQDIVIGMVSPFVPDAKKEKFDREYRMQTYAMLKFVDVEDLTAGMTSEKLPDPIRWFLLILTLLIPAGVGLKKHTDVFEKIKKNRNKRTRHRKKEKQRIDKENKQGKEDED